MHTSSRHRTHKTTLHTMRGFTQPCVIRSRFTHTLVCRLPKIEIHRNQRQNRVQPTRLRAIRRNPSYPTVKDVEINSSSVIVCTAKTAKLRICVWFNSKLRQCAYKVIGVNPLERLAKTLYITKVFVKLVHIQGGPKSKPLLIYQ